MTGENTPIRPPIKGGPLLGVPPLVPFVRAMIGKLVSPTYWASWIRSIRQEGKVLAPLPIDVVKPAVLLPHGFVDSDSPASPLPESTDVSLGDIEYEWAGRTRTINEYLLTSATDALLFAHRGTLIGSLYANGWSADHAHQGWSTTKSFVSTLIGIALDNKVIDSVDDPCERYVPALVGTAWEGVTLQNLLRMRSGVHWDEHTDVMKDNTQTQEWVALILDYFSKGRRGKSRNDFLMSLPRVEDQGVTFNYNSANTQVLAWVLEQAYGQPFNVILSEQLWKPAGMEAPANIMTDRQGAAIASQELYVRPRDFVRFGELIRNGGIAANSTRIVSAQWIADATTQMKPAMDVGDIAMGGYGYQWWSGATPDGFQANGFQGQFITVSPTAELTGVRLGHTMEFSTSMKFSGQGNPEWHAVFRAVIDHLGVLDADTAAPVALPQST